METKSVLESRRSWFNYGSILAIALTAIIADEGFKDAIKDLFGAKGAVMLMVAGALVNQYLTQTSDERPTFQLPKKKKPEDQTIVEKHEDILKDIEENELA